MFWPFPRRSRSPTTKAVRGLVATKSVFSTIARQQGHCLSPYRAIASSYGGIRSPSMPLVGHRLIVI